MNHYDDQTSESKNFIVPIDKHLKECEKLPVVEFNPIPSKTIELDSTI